MVENLDGYSEVWGVEWDFLAVDSAGHVAQVSTAGFGPIPDRVLAAREVVEHAISGLAALPVNTQAIPEVAEREGNYSEWYSMSERGLFAYDWHGQKGRYERISTPADALAIDSLPDDIQTAARIVEIPSLFADTSVLRPR